MDLSTFLDEPCVILSNRPVLNEVFHLVLASDFIAKRALPGQFVHLLVSSEGSLVLRRPFSIFLAGGEGGDKFEIVYKVVGRGTRALSLLKPGDFVRALGPLGKGFRAADDARRHILIAGGTGIAPLFYLYRHLRGKGENALLFYGERSRSELIFLEDLATQERSCFISTEDGSFGVRGTALDAVESLCVKVSENDVVYACGPESMLREVKRRYENACRVQLSVEARMACGVGACLSCAVKSRGGVGDKAYLLACKDGPVFEAGEIDL